ncbi:MAG TPA: hypothetical protein VIL35_15840, partial [Vicinamibacterales bacterium]
LFVPVMAGLYARRTGAPEVMAAILGGVAMAVAGQLGLAYRFAANLTPAMLGLIASCVAWALLYSVRASAPDRT